MRFSYLHDPCQSIHICKSYPILFYHLKNLLYQLYNTILQYTQHLNFYFSILLIKIIYLHNKIFFFFFFSQFSPPHAYVPSRLLHTFTFHILPDSSIPIFHLHFCFLFLCVFPFFFLPSSFVSSNHYISFFFSFFVLLFGSHSLSIPNQQLVTASISGSHKLTSFLNLQHHTSTAQSPPLHLHHAHHATTTHYPPKSHRNKNIIKKKKKKNQINPNQPRSKPRSTHHRRESQHHNRGKKKKNIEPKRTRTLNPPSISNSYPIQPYPPLP